VIVKKIDIGSLITMGVVIIGAAISYGTNFNKINNLEQEQQHVVKKVQNNVDNIVNLKVSVAKIETQLDNRFDRLEEILMELE
tara:strand:+ start:2117 stop:2365 length:249 start_codon:yes stop_codon:yes gene_type:complete